MNQNDQSTSIVSIDQDITTLDTESRNHDDLQLYHHHHYPHSHKENVHQLTNKRTHKQLFKQTHKQSRLRHSSCIQQLESWDPIINQATSRQQFSPAKERSKLYHQSRQRERHQNLCFILAIAAMIGLLMDQSGMRIPTTEGSPVDDMFRQWLHDDDHTLHAAKLEDFNKEKNLTSGVIDIEVSVDKMTLEVKVDGKRVMYKYNETRRDAPNSYSTIHRGVGVVVLHPTNGEVMLTTHFETGKPRAFKGLLKTLNSLQAGRILILAAPGDWTAHVNEHTREFLEHYLGGWWVSDVCYGEMWVGVGLIGGPLWAEAATAVANYTTVSSSPLHVAVTVPKFQPGQRCEWYSNPEHKDRAHFCEIYEGYGEFCSCNTTNITSPAHAPLLDMKEQIPIVIATSRHQSKVLKQLHQLWTQAGGGNTSILLSIDGLQSEAREFAKIMGLQTVFHINPAKLGTLARISQHIMFSIYHVFRLNPEANKIIVLEDDLMVSPDFISYFHQTAPLLDADKSIFCINAYNYNSFLPTAIDTSRLYREDVLPAYGWMITREISHELLPLWPLMSYTVDWDWYVRAVVQKGRVNIAPEVPRTYHDGHGGFHITGYEQTAYFDRRPLNADPDAKVNISYLTSEAYELFLENELRTATVLEIKGHPCEKEYIPKEKVGSFLVHYYGETEKDKHIAYYTLVACLNGYERGRMEHHRLMHALGYYGNALYVVACPGSYYCRVKEEDYDRLVYNATKEDLVTSILYKQKYVKEITQRNIYLRIEAEELIEKARMLNYVILDDNIVMTEIGEDGQFVI